MLGILLMIFVFILYSFPCVSFNVKVVNFLCECDKLFV